MLYSTVVNDCQSEIDTYAEMIETYGPVTIILAIFIILLLATFSIILKIMHNSNKQIMDQQKQMLSQLLKTDKITKERNIVEIFVKLDTNLKSILTDIKYKLNADRISVYVFHNGVHSSHGLPFFKTSCVSEVISNKCSISKKILDHTGMNLAMFDTSITELYKSGSLAIPKIGEKANIYPVIHNMLHKEKVVSATSVAIYDTDHNILGVLIAEFIEDKSNVIDSITNQLAEYTKSLSLILEYSDYQHFSDNQ